jgi:hypothetical protein
MGSRRGNYGSYRMYQSMHRTPVFSTIRQRQMGARFADHYVIGVNVEQSRINTITPPDAMPSLPIPVLLTANSKICFMICSNVS